jgi:hypothetical protein
MVPSRTLGGRQAAQQSKHVADINVGDAPRLRTTRLEKKTDQHIKRAITRLRLICFSVSPANFPQRRRIAIGCDEQVGSAGGAMPKQARLRNISVRFSLMWQCDGDLYRCSLPILPLQAATRAIEAANADQNPLVKKGYERRVQTIQLMHSQVLQVHRQGIADRRIASAKCNWWEALNSITAWVGHVQETKSDRYAHLLFGSGDRLKSAALKHVVAEMVYA